MKYCTTSLPGPTRATTKSATLLNYFSWRVDDDIKDVTTTNEHWLMSKQGQQQPTTITIITIIYIHTYIYNNNNNNNNYNNYKNNNLNK